MVERLSATTESWRPQRRESVFDPQIRRMALIAFGAIGVVVAGVAGYEVLPHHPRGIPVIEADPRPLRVKPDNPGGMQVIGADEMAGAGIPGKQDVMAPPPEVPQPQVLRAEIQAARKAEAPPPPVAAPSPALTPPLAVAAAPAMVAPPVVAPSLAAPSLAARTPARTPLAPAPTTGGTEVQLAAMESEQAAMAEWGRLQKRMPDVMAAKRPVIMRAERAGKTFYRLRTGGFTDIAQATTFCTQMKAKGAACAIASF